MNRSNQRLFMFFIVYLFVNLSIHAQSRQDNSNTKQKHTVSGRITELSGDPLPGVSIVVKGMHSMGTVSGDNGYYILEGVPSDAALSFSFVGFKTVEVPVNGRTELNVQLREDVTALPEVTINAGYYTVKDEYRTGSIARVTAKEIENQPVSNALSAVQGRMAGVNIFQRSGIAGGGYDIQIRGINSLRRDANYPMYIIDGVPVISNTTANLGAAILPYTEINPLNAIHPNDIESIEILKDADATAIYGSRGANGVILITTKKGKATSKTNISVNTNYSFSNVGSKMELMDTQQYLEMRKQAFANDGYTDYPANAYDVNGKWDQSRFTDWQEALIGKTASSPSIHVSINGGNENTNFLLTGSHSGQTTVFDGDFEYVTNNLSGSLSHRSNDKKLTINTSSLFSTQNNNVFYKDVTYQALRLSPNAPALYQEDGSINWENNTFTNPIASYEATYTNNTKTLNNNFNINYYILPSISAKFNGGIDYNVFEEVQLNPNSMYNPAFGSTPAISNAQKSHNQRFSYLLEPQLNYKRSFSEHQLDILAGITYQQTKSSFLSTYSYGYETNALIHNTAAASKTSIKQDNETEYKYAAMFGRVNYKYKDRYILNLTGRRDGSSRFGPDKQFANFGAVGVSWLFHKEKFLSGIPWFSFGKARGSIGVTGSDAIGDYQYLDSYTTSSTIYGDGTTLYPSRLYNPNFSWEKTTKLEMALELGFFNDRIRLNAAWYRNRSGNQLVGIPLPGTTGFSSIQANLPATVENKGLELELYTNPVKTRTFNWNSDFNISFVKNKLVSYPGLEGSTYAFKYVVGYPISIVKLYNYEGIDPETGLYKFTDYNGDGKITSPEDNLAIGEIGVKYYGGWSNQLSYKNLQLSFLFQFTKQEQLDYHAQMSKPGTMFNQPVEVTDVWSKDNPDGKYMPYSTGSNPEINTSWTNFKKSTGTVGDASFIKLKNIQLSYLLHLKKHIRDIRFYVQGQNLFTITNYFGLDPEVLSASYLPILKTYSLGIQITF